MAPGLDGCIRCREGPPRRLDRCVARVTYEHPWTDLIARFKFQGEPAWAGLFASLMLTVPEAEALLADTDLIAPVPISTERLRERGYNQAWELVKALRRHSPAARQLQAWPDLLEHQALQQPQHALPRAERFDNAHRAFHLHPGHAAGVAGVRILLVDDVMTTGATLEAAAERLLDHGAASVSALVFARTPDPMAP
jgi:ComF family protein